MFQTGADHRLEFQHNFIAITQWMRRSPRHWRHACPSDALSPGKLNACEPWTVRFPVQGLQVQLRCQTKVVALLMIKLHVAIRGLRFATWIPSWLLKIAKTLRQLSCLKLSS